LIGTPLPVAARHGQPCVTDPRVRMGTRTAWFVPQANNAVRFFDPAFMQIKNPSHPAARVLVGQCRYKEVVQLSYRRNSFGNKIQIVECVVLKACKAGLPPYAGKTPDGRWLIPQPGKSTPKPGNLQPVTADLLGGRKRPRRRQASTYAQSVPTAL
jgi:hypothetical protein